MKSLIIKVISIIFLFMFSKDLNSQTNTIDVTTQISIPYSPYLSDYFGSLSKVSIIVRNTSNKLQRVKLGFDIEGDNGVKISSKPVFTTPQPLILNPNQTVIVNNTNIKNYSDNKNFDLVGINKITFFQTGMLPDGNYNFCVRAYNFDDGSPLSLESPSGCTSLEIVYPDPPILLQPENEDSLNLSNVIFTWIGSPQAPLGAQFKLQIAEMLLPNSNPDAVLNSTSFFYYDKTLLTTSYIPLPNDPPFKIGKSYAWRVIAKDPANRIQFKNNGISESRKFTFKNNDLNNPNGKEKSKSKDTSFNQSNNKSLASGDTTTTGDSSANVTTGDLNPTDTLHAGLNGEFTVFAKSITKANGKYSGIGTVYVNWLKASLSVKFDSITVDTTKRLLSGDIIAKIDSTAPVYPQALAISAALNSPFTNAIASSVVNWIKNKTNQSVLYNGLSSYSTPLELPLGLNFPDSNQLAITEMVFRSNKSEFNMVAAKTTPASWGTQQLVGFQAINIKFHPSKIQTPPERIELLEDLSFGNTNNKILFILKKPDSDHTGCYVEWGEDGFSGYGIEIEAKFTRDWIVPSPDDSSQTSAKLVAIGEDWNNLILTGMLNKSEIIGTNGMTILADSISYDMSDNANPGSIVFPQGYTGETSNLFRGFYMKALKLEMPETWKTNAGGKPLINIQNMIIDNTGLSFLTKATNVIQFPNANVADLVASIDTINVKMISSSLIEANIKGKIGLPVSKKDSIQNPLKYVALFNGASPDKSFQLTIVPTGPIFAHLFKGTLDLSQTSNITAYVDKHKKKFNMVLNGDFSWDNIQLGPVKNVKLGLKFQTLGFNYDSSLPDGFTFNAGSWSFASAQKLMANFPVTIKNIGFKMLTAQPGEMLRGKLNFDVIFNLSEVIGGMTKLGVSIAIKDGTNGQKFYPEYIGTSLDSISIYTNMSAAKIQGSIAFINSDPVFGDGFKGDISAKFNSINLFVSVGAFFGNTSYHSSQRYRYWKVEALAILPPPGVVFMSGLAFRGFGVAAYHHMNATYAGVTLPSPSATSSMSTTSGAVFTPNDTIAFGFKIKAIIATTPKEQTFNADVGISGEFTNSGGMTFLRFDGAFWVGAGFDKRVDAFMNGSVVANYNFPTKTFYLGAAVGINRDPISTPTPATLELLINGKDNLWHFIAGTPQNPNTVKIAGINLTSYAMFGNDIVPPPNFMQSTINGYSVATNGGSLGAIDGSLAVNDETKAGKGFAFGVGINNSGAGSYNIVDRLSAQWTYSVGGELNLSLMEYSPGCITGMKGWYAKGNVAIYGGFSVGGHVSAKGRNGNCTESTCLVYCCKNYPNGYNFTIGAFGFGAWASGGFPKPTYLQGGADITYNVLDIASGSYHAEFKIGDACSGDPIGVPTNFIQEDAANSQQQQLIINILPSGNNIDTTTSLKSTYGFTPNQVFDVAEQQLNGTVLNRTFQAKYVASFEKKVDGVFQNEIIHSNGVNSLGQYEFTTGSNILQNNSISTKVNIVEKQTTTKAIPIVKNASKLPAFGSTTSIKTIGISKTEDNPTENDLGYGTLPPPSPDVINKLTKNTTYRFTVNATLYELKNNIWVIAKNKNGINVTQKKVSNFRTGPIEIAVISKPLNSKSK